jgi:hypothetical protein
MSVPRLFRLRTLSRLRESAANVFSAGDSRNFSISGSTFSATFLNSEAEFTSRIFEAKARPISSRAETAEAVILSGLSSTILVERKSVPHARQN